MSADEPAQLTQDNALHAIVLSGNGSNGAYEVGVLKALLQGVSQSTQKRPFQPEIYTGTSVGAFNAAIMVSESEESDLAAIEKLENIWVNQIGASMQSNRGVPRFRGNPFDYAQPVFYLPNPLKPLLDLGRDSVVVARALLQRAGDFLGAANLTNPVSQLQDLVFDFDWSLLTDTSPLQSLAQDVIDPAKIRRSPKQLRLTVANWKSGTTRTFDNHALDDADAYRMVAASMAIPGGMPPVEINLEEFVDGAVLMKNPLQPAIQAAKELQNGVRKRRLILHVIYLDPEYSPPQERKGSFSTVYRTFVLVFSRAVNADIRRAENINRNLQLLDLLRDVDPIKTSTEGDDRSEVLELWRRLNKETAHSVELEIHRYRSAKHLGGIMDLFQFNMDRVKGLIKQGYQDAIDHNCEDAECIRTSLIEEDVDSQLRG
jgi:predicted acylesterase/phospholipase RssA